MDADSSDANADPTGVLHMLVRIVIARSGAIEVDLACVAMVRIQSLKTVDAEWLGERKNNVNLIVIFSCKQDGGRSMSSTVTTWRRLKMRRAAGCLAAICACLPAYAAGPVDEAYVRSLAAPGKTVLVMEYYDGQGKVSERKGYASASGFKAVSPTDFRVDANLTVHLYGIEPCKGDMVNRKEGFAGPCDEYARRGLETLLQSPKVIYCRAFVSETGAQSQDATCYGYYNYPGSLDTVDMFEEQLVSLGTHRATKRPDGTPARADLMEAEDIGRGGYGMWADPRIARQ